MTEGFFHPHVIRIPDLAHDVLCAAMVRILPATILHLDIVPTQEVASERSRNEILPDGYECWHRFFTTEDLKKVCDPEFALGMVRHEFSQVVKTQGTFPCVVPLQGSGTGFAITADGHVLTNYHLVTPE